jgi:hypothetical protein
LSSISANSFARWLAPLIGFAAFTLALWSWQIPPAGGALGTTVRFAAIPPGEIAATPTGSFGVGRVLQPGRGQARGELTLINVSGKPLSVHARTVPSNGDLDHMVQVKLTAGRWALDSGTLTTRPTWSTSAIVLPPRTRITLGIEAWLPPSVRAGYEGRDVVVTVELQADQIEVGA